MNTGLRILELRRIRIDGMEYIRNSQTHTELIMTDSTSPEPSLIGYLSPKARAVLWSTFWTSIAQKENAKEVTTREWNYVLRMLQVDFWGRGTDEYDPSLESVSTQYKPLFMEGPAPEVIRLLQKAVDRLGEARHLARNDTRSFFGAMDYWLSPRPRGNFARLLDNTFKEYGMPYYVDMSGKPIIVHISNPVEEEAIGKALEFLPQAGYKRANRRFREAIKCLNKGDWKSCVQESIMGLESVAVTITSPRRKTLGSAMTDIRKEGRVHEELCNSITSIWRFTNQEPGIRHEHDESSDLNTDVGSNEAYLMLLVCIRFAVYLDKAYR